jgi:hypothetical protein
VKTLSGNVTEQLCAESVKTGRVHSGDTELIPAPEGQFWAYMGELTALSK